MLHSCPEKSRQEASSASRQPTPAQIIQESPEVCKAIDRFLDGIVLYSSMERDMKVSRNRIHQAIYDGIYQLELGSWHRHLTGSFHEGLPEEVCGDRDIMVTNRSYPVALDHSHVNPSTANIHKTGYVIINYNPDQPAYITLTVPDGLSYQSAAVTKSIENYNGSNYLSSFLFVPATVGDDTEAHGPAKTTAAFSQNPARGMSDIVPCLQCPFWPPWAQELFKSRTRLYDWPPRSLLDHIEQAGCHVVGVGHRSTKRRDLEWRLSFSVAERLSIQHMSTDMAGSIYLLKALKKPSFDTQNDSTTDTPQAMCSFYFKVACLWVAELNEPARDIIENVRNTLDWLIQSYQNHKLPHYFIPDQNLIGHLSHDACKEVISTLTVMKSQLWLQVLCSVTMNTTLKTLIKSLQLELGITQVVQPTLNDYKQLLTTILGFDKDKARKLLEEASSQMATGSELYVHTEHYWMGYRAAAYYAALHDTIGYHITTSSALEVVALPDKVILPIINKLTSLIKPSHLETFRSSLYRYLAEIYHNLYIEFKRHRNNSNGIQDMCYQKSKALYTEGVHILYPDGWTDKGLSGYVLLAKFYYLNGEWDQLKGALSVLHTLLEDVKYSPETLNALPHIVVDTRYDLCKLPWRRDPLLYRPLVEMCNDVCVNINPASLGFYLQGRLYLRQGDWGAVEKCLRSLEQVRKALWSVNQKKTTPVFIEVLITYLAEYKQGVTRD